jgi:hypothetical protein
MAISPGKAIISIARALLSVRFQTSRSRPTFGWSPVQHTRFNGSKIVGFGGWHACDTLVLSVVDFP